MISKFEILAYDYYFTKFHVKEVHFRLILLINKFKFIKNSTFTTFFFFIIHKLVCKFRV